MPGRRTFPLVALVILDGWGCAPGGPGNAVSLAKTPVFDELWQSLQWRVTPLRKIYESFLSVAHETLDILHRAAATDDGSVLARRVHTLLGSAGMVGARQVERVAALLQEALKSDRRAELESGRVLLAETVRRFETELEKRLAALQYL